MITKNEEVKLIDFDYAGVYMESQYPLLLSHNLMWPVGMKALSIMKTEHDNNMLAQLLLVIQFKKWHDDIMLSSILYTEFAYRVTSIR
jgi:hypothetical protein